MNIPPGLTCAKCEKPLTPNLARLDGEVYIHARACPCRIEDCDRKHHGKGYCEPHYRRHVVNSGAKVDRHLHIELEDVEWMAATGENLIGAAERLGSKSADALEAWLKRKGRPDLAADLKARNPRDWNKTADGTGVTKDILGESYRVKAEKRNERRRQMRQRPGGVAA